MLSKAPSVLKPFSDQTRLAVFIFLMTLLAGVYLSGCANVAHNMAIKGVGGVNAAYQSLEPPFPGDGRLILYWEKKPLMATTGRVKLHGAAGYVEVAMATQLGAILDLPAGEYTLSMGGVLNKREIALSIEAGQTVCCNTETLYSFITGPMSGDLKLVPIEQGLQDLVKNDIRCTLKSCQEITVIANDDPNPTPYQSETDQKQAERRSKIFDVSPTKSRIYVTRDVYTLGMVKAGVDSAPNFTMSGDTYFCFEVNPGLHVITVSDPTGKRGFKIDAKGGESCFFHTDTLDFLDPSEGQKLVGKYDLLKKGFLFE